MIDRQRQREVAKFLVDKNDRHLLFDRLPIRRLLATEFRQIIEEFKLNAKFKRRKLWTLRSLSVDNEARARLLSPNYAQVAAATADCKQFVCLWRHGARATRALAVSHAQV